MINDAKKFNVFFSEINGLRTIFPNMYSYNFFSLTFQQYPFDSLQTFRAVLTEIF